jgi:AraC-like DNA-binding protein
LPTALICNEGQEKTKNLEHSLTNLYGWHIRSSFFSGFLPPIVDEDKNEYDLHFIIFSKKLSAQTCKELHEVRKQMPFSFIIYYYRCLLNRQFLLLAELEVNSCIIGIHRKNYLRELLPHLWQTHWKRIPESIYPADSYLLPPRARKVLNYIENHPLEHFNLHNLSRLLRISESHFRAEFRHNFGINFREFKQRLINHYESELLLDKDYTPKGVYKLLNYSNLSNLSRSFKKRHGDSWRKLRSEEEVH